MNALPADRAAEVFTSCCGAHRWVAAMVERRPFASRDALVAMADDIWRSLGPDDWREAFSHHPRIGERAAAAGQSAVWSSNEQSSVTEADGGVLAALAAVNAEYERRFGFTYIVRAAGRSASEMLGLAKARLANDLETELRVAAEQQREIMQLRIGKLFDEATT